MKSLSILLLSASLLCIKPCASDCYMLAFNGKTYHHRIKKTEIKLLALLPFLKAQTLYPKFYWKEKNQTEERAAIGSLISSSEPIVFDSENDSPACFYGGLSFAANQNKDAIWNDFPSLFFLPKFEFIQDENRCLFIEHFLENEDEVSLNWDIPSFSSFSPSFSSREDTPSFQEWERLIAHALREFETSPLQKVVLARRTSFACENFCPLAFLASIQNNTTVFALAIDANQCFFGATPECLYRRKDKHIFCEAIAGTEKNEDSLKNMKYDHEFDFVPKNICQALGSLCQDLHLGEKKILPLKNMFHFYQTISGVLKENISDRQLIQALHPTAAIGGVPKERALSHIRLQEPFERGLYSGPIGWISQKETSLYAAIRSGFYQSFRLHLFAGAGIVKGSDPETEWEELETKTSPIMEYFYAFNR